MSLRIFFFKIYKKCKLKTMRELELRESRPTCMECFRPKKACFCQHISKIKTRTLFVILMHPSEIKKGHIGTGRLTHLSLPNSKIIIGTEFRNNKELESLITNPTNLPLLLYPAENALDLKKEEHRERYLTQRPVIFIIDATWPRAKKMIKNSPILHKIERISFNTKHTSQFLIKQQPSAQCLSTIESTFETLKMLKELKLESFSSAQSQKFLKPLKELVIFHQNLANDPKNNNYNRLSKSTSNPSQRKPSKKWESRPICFKF